LLKWGTITVRRVGAFAAFFGAIAFSVVFVNWPSISHRRQAALVPTALRGETNKMKLLLSAGANANEPACEGSLCVRPLFAAALCDCPDAVRLLLDNGANVNGKSKDGQTALVAAAYEGHAATVKLLLLRGADPSVQWEGLTALEWARQQQHSEIINLLENKGAGE